jgi:hypothetical protein
MTITVGSIAALIFFALNYVLARANNFFAVRRGDLPLAQPDELLVYAVGSAFSFGLLAAALIFSPH